MNKLILITCSAFFISSQLFAQDSLPRLCNVYAALMEESFTKFSGMAGNEIASPNNYKRTASTLEVKNANACYIETTPLETYWYAEYGAFSSLDEAKKKIKLLQAEFLQCFPLLEFIEHADSSTISPIYNLKENTADGINFLKGELGIQLSSDEKYIPFFRMPENATTLHYFNISGEPDTTAFASGVSRLITESVIGFKNILGSKIAEDKYSTTFFKSTYCLPGSMECGITEKVVFKSYEAYYLKNSAAADAYLVLEKLSDKVAGALGKKYVRLATENGTLFTESSKANVTGSWVIEVKKEKGKGNTFNILIRVNEQTNY